MLFHFIHSGGVFKRTSFFANKIFYYNLAFHRDQNTKSSISQVALCNHISEAEE